MCIRDRYLPGEFPQDDKNPTEKENGIDHSGIAIEGKGTYKVEPKKEEPKRKLEDYYSDTLPTDKAYYTITHKPQLAYAKGVTDADYYNSKEYFSRSALERIMKAHDKLHVYKADPKSKGLMFGQAIHDLMLTDVPHKEEQKEAARKLFNSQRWILDLSLIHI